MEAVEKQSKWIAVIGTIVLHALILLLFVVVTNTTPIPPYPAGDGLEIGVSFGNLTEGTGNVNDVNMGDNEPNPTTEAASQPRENTVVEDDHVTNDAEETAYLNSKKTPKEKQKPEVKPEQPVEQKASQELLKALNAFKDRKSGNPGGGKGASGEPGGTGDPSGGMGDGTSGVGDGTFGPGTWKLSGRKMIGRPSIIDDSQEEGKVIVAIIVDESGKVISAEPGQRGSTTTSSILWAKARQAALSSKFNPSPEGAKEQHGTMTFVFVLN